MATYDQGQPIKNADVVTLLANINTLMSRTGGMGTSSFTTYKNNLIPVSASTSVSANAGTSAISAQAAGLRIIQHLLKGGYMNVSSTQQAAATALINQAYPDAGNSMIALTNAYTVVNYWNSGNSEANHYGCNGACVGYCTGSCGGTAKKGTGNGSSNLCSSCNSICYGSCSGCNSTCTATCGGLCANTCYNGCGGGCTGNCSGGCRGTCTSGCVNACSGACGGTCKGGNNTV